MTTHRTIEEIAIERIGREAFAKIVKAEGAATAIRAAVHRMLADQHQERAIDWQLPHTPPEPMTHDQHPTREELLATLETVRAELDAAREEARGLREELEHVHAKWRHFWQREDNAHKITRQLLAQATKDGRRMHQYAYQLQDAKAAHEKDLARLRTALARVAKQLERYAATINPPEPEPLADE